RCVCRVEIAFDEGEVVGHKPCTDATQSRKHRDVRTLCRQREIIAIPFAENSCIGKNIATSLDVQRAGSVDPNVEIDVSTGFNYRGIARRKVLDPLRGSMDIASNWVNDLSIDAVRIERYADIQRSLDPYRLGNLEKIVANGVKQDVSRNRINANGIGVARMEKCGRMYLGTVR